MGAKFKWHPGTGIAEAVVANWMGRRWKFMSLVTLGPYTLTIIKSERRPLPHDENLHNAAIAAWPPVRKLHMADARGMKT